MATTGVPSGIQELMAAETRATTIVKEARDQKVEKMKQAKQQANSIIEEYRQQMEAEFLAKTQDLEVKDDSTKIQEQTSAEIQKMKGDYAANKEATIEMMLNYVCTVSN
eukprot:CAMPEP_0185743386 /NCGR_PEP_ID=MMETSP1174-20130828/1073_1 /TAXON_ID=35687 /ORGANISM="Dictyocha speculum, Strain CCMP1381" /LENGTH=108 /DNA_ID=CAMNT_0028416009 /DNA_START=17 /DNA_END=343 /DNA_ORIENTATION=+